MAIQTTKSHIINASMNGVLYGYVRDSSARNLCFQVEVRPNTGLPTGRFSLEGSIDGSVWHEVLNSRVNIVDGYCSELIEFPDPSSLMYRAKVEIDSGVDTVQADVWVAVRI